MINEQAREAAIAEWKARHDCPELGLKTHDGAVMVFGEGYDVGYDAGAKAERERIATELEVEMTESKHKLAAVERYIEKLRGEK